MSRRMISQFLLRTWFLAGLLLASAATAQIVPDEFIVELVGSPAIPTTPVKAPRSVAARASVRAVQARVQAAMEGANIQVLGSVDTVLNALIVRSADAAALHAIPGVARVYPVRMYKPVMDRAVNLQKITAAGAWIGGAENAGAGIKIGVIDTGVDSKHPAFRDDSFKLPDGFPRVNKDTDNAFTNNKVIVARNYDSALSSTAGDMKGHGTAVAAVAAGVRNTGPYGSYMGVAPKAYVGNYKVFPNDREGAPDRLILQALNDAVNDGMDVINLSLGGFPAPRLDDDPLVKAVENAIRAGVVVVVAAGNEGPGPATIGSPATAPLAIAVGASLNDRLFASSVAVDGLDPLIGVPGSASGSASPVRAAIVDVAGVDPTGLLCQAIPEGSLAGSVVLIRRGECFFEEKLNFAQAAGAIAAVVSTDADRPDASRMSVGTARLPAMMISHADGLRAAARLREGSAEVLLNFEQKALLVSSANLAQFTSKGPSVESGLKPDLLAVGTAVYTAQPGDFGSPGYGVVQGTSFSAPMIAGAAALLKAFRPGLTVEAYKSLLVNTASTFLSREGIHFPMQHTGAGLLDMEAAVQSTLLVSPSSVEFGAGGQSTDLTRRIVLRNLGSASDTFAITVEARQDGAVPTVTPNVVEIPAAGTAEVIVQWRASGLTARAYEGFLVARGAQSERATRIPYWYAAIGGTAASIAAVEAPESGKPASSQEFYVRALDAAGIPVVAMPSVNVQSEILGTRVGSIESFDAEYPGFYRIRVSLGEQPGANVFEVVSGTARVRVTINGV